MENVTPEKIAQIKDLLKEMDYNPSNSSLIQDNKIIFSSEHKCYRCRMPSQRHQSQAESVQNKFKIKLLQDSGNIIRKNLIKDLKEFQDIDIHELNKEKEKLKTKLQDLYLDLAIVPTENEVQLNDLKDKKNKIEEDFMSLSIEIAEYLSPCIEEQIKSEYYKFLAFACTEKLVSSDISGEDKWELLWKSFDEYQNDETTLTYLALDNIQTLLLNIRD